MKKKTKAQVRAAEIIQRLVQSIPKPDTALNHDNAFQLLIATILSAQCTDVRVNQVTPILFEAFPGPTEMLQANPERLSAIIHSTGFYRNKTKNIIGTSRRLIEVFSGCVPENLEDLITLPGVGRKTANVVLGTAFHQQTIVVDTHVRRVANRLDLSQSNDPTEIEYDLNRLLDKKSWTSAAHRLLLHGRHVCKSRKPLCEGCVLFELCPEKQVLINT